MKTETAKKLVQPFDKANLKQLKGMTYVPIAEVVNRCNSVLGVGNWRPEVLHTEGWGSQETQYGPCPVHIIATVRVHVRDDDTGEWTWADGMGGQDVVFFKDRNQGPTNLGDAYKGACSDATKKALQHFGVGLELARDGQPSETAEQIVDLVTFVKTTVPAAIQSPLKSAWPFPFTASQVPLDRQEEVRNYVLDFVDRVDQETGEITPSEPKAEERSDGGPGAKIKPALDAIHHDNDRTPGQAQSDLGSIFRADPLRLSPVSAVARVNEIWDAAGYADNETINPDEWAVLAKMAQNRIDELTEPKATAS